MPYDKNRSTAARRVSRQLVINSLPHTSHIIISAMLIICQNPLLPCRRPQRNRLAPHPATRAWQVKTQPIFSMLMTLIGALLTPICPAAPPATAAHHDTPVVELRAVDAGNDVLAIILSGDGGWADLDRDFGNAFQKKGISTLGFDCLKYFWQIRQPDEVSRDVNEVLRHYLSAWQKHRLLLVGYSFGASWLPFLINRLPPDLQARVTLVALLAPAKYANVEIKVNDWFAEVHRPGALDVTSEAARIRLPLLCVYGAEQEAEALCPVLKGSNVRTLRMPGGHHFNQDYATVEAAILKYLETTPLPP
jgi:type IV secretory pathway VirJ component